MNRRLALSSFRATKLEFGQVANAQRKVGAFGDQILVAIRHHEIDLEQRMLGGKRRKQRHDAPDAVTRRQGDAQHAGKMVGAARRALRLVDREQGVARASKQRLARVGGGDLPGRAHEKLDAQAMLERRDGARHRGLSEAEFARGLGEASALDRADEQGELLEPIIHAVSAYIISLVGAIPIASAHRLALALKASGAIQAVEGIRSTAMGELSGKVAIVTGASKGIGAAIARRFAEAGAAVAVNYASDKAGADRVVEEIVRKGGKAVAIQASVSKGADVKRLFAETKAKLGAPSILVNNAGVFSFAPIEAVTEEDVERQFGTNVLGTLLASKEAVAAFDGAGGSIINLSTIASVNPVPNSVVYSSSKAAVDTITRALARRTCAEEDSRQRDRARSDGNRGHEDHGAYDGDRKGDGHGDADGPHGSAGRYRPRRPFLASDQSSWLTGERISASGGQR